jgi:hypothetical protein
LVLFYWITRFKVNYWLFHFLTYWSFFHA